MFDMYSFINVSAVGVVSGVFCRELRRKRGREESSVTYRAAGSGRGARVSAVCPDQRSVGGK